MANKEAFIEAIKNGYTFKGEAVKIGAAVFHLAQAQSLRRWPHAANVRRTVVASPSAIALTRLGESNHPAGTSQTTSLPAAEYAANCGDNILGSRIGS